MPGTRIVVTGATGNIGTATCKALAADDGIDEIIGVSRRRPAMDLERTTWPPAGDHNGPVGATPAVRA
jgi:UDP-glucose 4-epimerase